MIGPMETDLMDGDLPRTRPRILRWIIFGIVLLAVAGIIIYESATFLTQPPPRRGRFADAGGTQSVGVARIRRGDIRLSLNALGAVTPLTTVTVNTQISGQLLSVGFKEGQIVHKGQFLAQIDPRPYQVALEEDQAQLARDSATLQQAQMDLKRYQTLLAQQSIPRQTAEDQVYVVQQAQGTVDYDKAQIKAQQLNLAYCHIVAPSDGRVGLRLIDPGNYVQSTSTTGIVVLTLLHPISVIFTVPEDSLPQILARVQADARIPVTAFDRANVKQLAAGQYASIDNEVDTTTGTVRLRAEFDNAGDTLFPSQFVNVVMLLDTLKDVVTVPIAAVQRGAPGTYVYLVNADNTVSLHPITLGAQDGDFFAVESGLAPADVVVTDGADRLRDGAHINIPDGPAAAAPGVRPDGQARRHRGNGDARGSDARGADARGGASSGGGGDADAAARRERWRQRRQQQDRGTDTPAAAAPPAAPAPATPPASPVQ